MNDQRKSSKEVNTLQEKQKTRTRRRIGQGLLEFALVLPIFLLLLYGVVEFGRYLSAIITINTASREAARYASGVGNNDIGVPYYQDCTGIAAAAQRLGLFASIDTIDIRYDHGPDDTRYTNGPTDPIEWATLPQCSSSVRVDLADRVLVRVEGEYQPLLIFTELSFPLDSMTARTFVTKLDVRSTQYVVDTPVANETAIVDYCDNLSISFPTRIINSPTHHEFTITNSGAAGSVSPAIIDEIWITHTETKQNKYFETLEIIDITDPANPYSIVFDDTFPEEKKQTRTTYLPYNENILDDRTGTPVGIPGESTYQIIFSFTDSDYIWATIEIRFYNEDYEDCILKQP